MLNNQSSPNWVLGHAECNLKNAFEELKKIVERDVKEANRVIAGRQFSLEHSGEDDQSTMIVSGSGEVDGVVVRFGTLINSIRINGGGNVFLVTPIWDGRRCRMSVVRGGTQEPGDRGSIHELWEISQMALTKLFFAEWPAGSRNSSGGHQPAR